MKIEPLDLPDQKTDIGDYTCGIDIREEIIHEATGFYKEVFAFAVAYRHPTGKIIFQCCKSISNNFWLNDGVRPSDHYINRIKAHFPGITIMKETN